MQKDYVAVANRMSDATTGNLRRELADLALHAQRVGADVNVRFAQVVSEFANRIGSYRTGRARVRLRASIRRQHDAAHQWAARRIRRRTAPAVRNQEGEVGRAQARCNAGLVAPTRDQSGIYPPRTR